MTCSQDKPWLLGIFLKAAKITYLHMNLYAYRRTAMCQKAVRLHSFIFSFKDSPYMNRTLENGHIN